MWWCVIWRLDDRDDAARVKSEGTVDGRPKADLKKSC